MATGIVHRLRKLSWWDGSAVMLCGATFAGGNHEGVVFVSANCPACQAVYEQEKRQRKSSWW